MLSFHWEKPNYKYKKLQNISPTVMIAYFSFFRCFGSLKTEGGYSRHDRLDITLLGVVTLKYDY